MTHVFDSQVVNVSPPLGGYDLATFVNKEKISEYVCQICHHISRNCVEVSCGNGHIFCHECISYHFRVNNHSCPVDRTANISFTPNDFVRRQILASAVKCKYGEHGCQWTDTLRSFDEHIGHCEYSPITCKFCEKEVAGASLTAHHETCDEFLVDCHYCMNVYPRRTINSHLQNCSKRPMDCTLLCGLQIAANEMKDHVQNACPERMVACEMTHIGCTAKIKVKDYEQHMQRKQLKHMQLQLNWLMIQNEQKTLQIKQMSAQITKLQAPEFVEVIGCSMSAINGIYKRSLNLKNTAIADEKKQEMENTNISANHRPCYKKCDGNNAWLLYFNVNQWILESNKLHIACCMDDALYPHEIQNRWQVWIKDSAQYLLQSNMTVNVFDVNFKISKYNTTTNNVSNEDLSPLSAFFAESNANRIKPSKISNVDGNQNDMHRESILSLISSISSSSTTNATENESDAYSNSLPAINAQFTDWSISIFCKSKYDQLYIDLLHTQQSNNNVLHQNPFGPPMVSHETILNHLSNVGNHNISLINQLWKLVSIPNSNLLTSNGFVAVCHMLDKISNGNSPIPQILPSVLHSNVLNNLTTTPVHRSNISNLHTFSNISFDTNLNTINIHNSSDSILPTMVENVASLDSNFLNFPTNVDHNDDFFGMNFNFNSSSAPTSSANDMKMDDLFTLNSNIGRKKRQPNENPSLMDSATHSTPNISPSTNASFIFDQSSANKIGNSKVSHMLSYHSRSVGGTPNSITPIFRNNSNLHRPVNNLADLWKEQKISTMQMRNRNK